MTTLHLFGMVAFGPSAVAPYCTCGLVFPALPLTTPAWKLRQAWQNHIAKKNEPSS